MKVEIKKTTENKCCSVGEDNGFIVYLKLSESDLYHLLAHGNKTAEITISLLRESK